MLLSPSSHRAVIDLHIQIDLVDEDHYLILATSDRSPLPARARLSKSTLQEIKSRARGLLRGEAFGKKELDELGKLNFDAIFHGEIRDTYRHLAALSSSGGYLRILLSVEDRELREIPWELMYDPWQKRLLGDMGKTTLVRHVEFPLDETVSRPDRALSLNILVVISEPEDLRPLNIDREKAVLEDALAEQIKGGRINLEYTNGRLANIKAALDRIDPDVLHFIGHGGILDGTPVLALEDQFGNPRYANPTLLENQLFPTMVGRKRRLQLIVLNACQTSASPSTEGYESMAHSLVRRVGSIIAMQYLISDVSASHFCGTLYQRFLMSLPLDLALNEARRSIRDGSPQRQRDWLSPVLVSSSSIPEITRKINPFKGPYYYGQEDETKFHGRDKEIQNLVDLVAQNPVTILFGPPACGKTSLLMAGFIPATTYPYQAIRIPVSEDLDAQLRNQVNDILSAQAAPTALPSGDLTAALEEFPENLILILDQVEQTRYLGEPVKKLVVGLIQTAQELYRDERGYKMVLSTRPDIDEEIPQIIVENVNAPQAVMVPLEMLDRDSMADVIEGVLLNTNIRFESRTITRILGDLNYEEQPNMMAVQVVCQAIFQEARRVRRKEVRPEFLSRPELGGVAKILADRLRIAEKLDDAIYAGGELANQILTLFVRSDGLGARSVLYEEIVLGAGSPEASERSILDRILDNLVEDSILRVENTLNGPRFELVHEAFIHQIEPLDDQTRVQRRIEEALCGVGNALLPLRSESAVISDLRSGRDNGTLILLPAHQKLVFRSALEVDFEHADWYGYIIDQQIVLDTLTEGSLSEPALVTGIPYLGLIAGKGGQLGELAQEELLILAKTGGQRVRAAASAALAPLLSPEALADEFTDGERLTSDHLEAIAIIYDGGGQNLRGFGSRTRRLILRRLFDISRLEILAATLRGGLLGATGFALVAMYNWYRHFILSNINRGRGSVLDWITLLPLGLMVFTLAFPGMGVISMVRTLAYILSGGRRERNAVWGAVLGSAAGTGFTLFLLTILAKVEMIDEFSWSPTGAGLILGALVAGSWCLTLLGGLWRRLSSLVSIGLGALSLFLFERLGWWGRGYLLLTPKWPWEASLIGGLIGLFIWLGLNWGFFSNQNDA